MRLWVNEETWKGRRQRMNVAEQRCRENQRRTAQGYPAKRKRRPLPFEYDELPGKPIRS